jgi:putative copper export protein/mono/diheme cytochrome c family protein
MDAFAIVLALARGAHVAALASLFGTLVSLALVAPAGLREAGEPHATTARHRLACLAQWSDGLALLLGVAWLLLETATIAGAATLDPTFGAVWIVLTDTRFGHLMLLRFGLLVLVPLLLGRRAGNAGFRVSASHGPAVTTEGAGRAPAEAALASAPVRSWRLALAGLLSGVAIGMQGGFGHAGAAGGSTGVTLLISEAMHLLAAGAWLGGLLPLLLLTRSLPPRAAATCCDYFSPVGLSAVLAIGCTAGVQAWILIGGWGGMFGTAYGHIALLKLGLFSLLLLLAGINRCILTGRLRKKAQPAATRAMQISLATETALGIAVIVAAAFLASSLPATHATPIWPFTRRPSADQLSDPYGRVLVLYALLPSLVAVAAVAAARVWRWMLWPALGALVACLVLAGSRLVPLLTVEAFPTSYETSPTEFAAGSIMRGKALFAANCTACHGEDARGDGPLARTLPLPPADLTAPHFWGHAEGDLYWFISHGIDASPGVAAMPPFGPALSSGKVWSLIDFLKANNAGYSMRTTGRWDHPTPLPQFDAVCADGSAINDDDLRGRIVHVIAATRSVVPPPSPPGIDVATIVLADTAGVKPLGTACVTVEPSAREAFALLLGVAPDKLAGTQALADADLWLRLRWRPGDPGNWNDARVLDAAIRDVAANPLPAGAAGGHAHHH